MQILLKEKNKFSNINFTDFTNGISAPKLTMSEQVKLEGLITYKEASQVLQKMKNNKSPGSSGFGAEFFFGINLVYL